MLITLFPKGIRVVCRPALILQLVLILSAHCHVWDLSMHKWMTRFTTLNQCAQTNGLLHCIAAMTTLQLHFIDCKIIWKFLMMEKWHCPLLCDTTCVWGWSFDLLVWSAEEVAGQGTKCAEASGKCEWASTAPRTKMCIKIPEWPECSSTPNRYVATI